MRRILTASFVLAAITSALVACGGGGTPAASDPSKSGAAGTEAPACQGKTCGDCVHEAGCNWVVGSGRCMNDADAANMCGDGKACAHELADCPAAPAAP